MEEITLFNFNQKVIDSHNRHYESSPTGLVVPGQPPNGNTIYHFYSTGEISQQKGGWAYQQRSEFITHGRVSYFRDLNLVLPKQAADETTYAILTEQECIYFRKKMMELIQTFKKREIENRKNRIE